MYFNATMLCGSRAVCKTTLAAKTLSQPSTLEAIADLSQQRLTTALVQAVKKLSHQQKKAVIGRIRCSVEALIFLRRYFILFKIFKYWTFPSFSHSVNVAYIRVVLNKKKLPKLERRAINCFAMRLNFKIHSSFKYRD